jgi:hypothetical protein
VAVISDPGANSLRRSSRRARYRDVNRKRYERVDDMNGLDRSRQRAPRHLIAAISPFATTAFQGGASAKRIVRNGRRGGAAIERLCVTVASQAARRAGAVVGAVVIPVAAAAVVLLASAHLF